MNENENGAWEHPEGCVLYDSGLSMLLKATDEQAGCAIKAAAAYFLYGEQTPDRDPLTDMILLVLKRDADRSLKRYHEACERNRRRSRARREAEEEREIYVLPD